MTAIGESAEPVKFRYWISACIGLTCALCFLVPSGYSYGPALIFLSGLVWLPKTRPALKLNRRDKILLATLIGYFAVSVVINLIHGASSRYYEEPSRYLLGALALLVILGVRPVAAFWWAGLCVGAASAGLFALEQMFWEGRERAFGLMNPIQFGNLAILMSGLCLAGLGWAKQQHKSQYWMLAIVVCSTLGVIASVLSGARGGWLALPFIALILFINLRNYLPRTVMYASIVGGLVFVVLLYFVPQTGIQERVNRGVTEVGQYLSGKHVGRSVGLRFEMWRAASTMVDEKPWVGWGEEGYIEPMLERIEGKKIRKGVSHFTHVHNDMLDVTVKRGLLGLAALLIVYLLPLAIFSVEAIRMKSQQVEAKAFAMSGVILVSSVALFGLTQAFFRHNSGVTLYVFFIAVIWGFMRCAQQREAELELR
ncbi:O-antigen ligase family protein [Gilvimarinus xylanilyticus]|uniref:O-antigen ligase family protein n=1 Tax=Gilvimarinus xylanilyticus TaxID=2944139 RepID=A0A9X2KX45_9GAMM|nr:O-antigen ligase family protein [Gilvimarinus xylanilyticus]MCP8900720.1 O-antigen ligase family protein [Gilvimarinus xylanilyticus]